MINHLRVIRRALLLSQCESITWKNGETDKIIVGFVGRLALEKRVADLKVLQSNPNIKLVIVGDGPHRNKLEQQLPEAIFLKYFKYIPNDLHGILDDELIQTISKQDTSSSIIQGKK